MTLAFLLALGASSLAAAEPDKKNTAEPRVDHFGDPLPDGAVARLGTVRFRYGTRINALAFGPDGKTLASLSTSETIIWETATGKPIRRLPGTAYDGWSLDYSPDGKMLASSSYVTFQLLDTATGKSIDRVHQSLAKPLKRPGALKFSPDSKFLAIGGDEGSLIAWEVATKKVHRNFTGHSQRVLWVDWSPDGKHLASVGEDSTIRLWDFATGNEVRQYFKGQHPAKGVKTVVFSSDGATLAASTSWAEPLLWDVKTGKELDPKQATAN
jgi:WD40 repeat protein